MLQEKGEEAWPNVIQEMSTLIGQFITPPTFGSIDEFVIDWIDGGNGSCTDLLIGRYELSETDATHVMNILEHFRTVQSCA
jgi:hypothetical protein